MTAETRTQPGSGPTAVSGAGTAASAATTSTTAGASPQPELKAQAAMLLAHTAGFIAHRTIGIGLSSGLIRALAEAPGATPEDLGRRLGLDAFYVSVWCRAAFAAGVLERSGPGYALVPHADTLLLDASSPAFIGGLYPLMQQPELLDRFEAELASGRRIWWDETSPEWIASVAGTGGPFYTRLIPGGLKQVPGLAEALAEGVRVLDTSCGTGTGLLRLAQHYPNCTILGVDGDRHSTEQAEIRISEAGLSDRISEAGLSNRISVFCSPLEEFAVDEPVSVVINNISMHECRDIDAVTERVKAALAPGGWFVISDFPFPADDEALRSVPGRIMSGIQYFEAQIDDQLLPRAAYDRLLTEHGFTDLGWFDLSPVHAVTYGRKED